MKFADMDIPQATGGGGSLFARYDDKGSLLGVFRGDPVVYKKHGWGKTELLCEGGECDACHGGDRAKQRFRINLIVEEGGQQVAKIFEGGVTVYQQLRALHDEGYNLEQTRLKVSKAGSGTDTTYTVMPAAKAITKDELALVAKVPLKDVRPRPRKEPGSDG